MCFSKMQLVSHRYTAVLYEPISKLYIYKTSAVYLSDARVTFFFFFFFFFFLLQDTEIEKSVVYLFFSASTLFRAQLFKASLA